MLPHLKPAAVACSGSGLLLSPLLQLPPTTAAATAAITSSASCPWSRAHPRPRRPLPPLAFLLPLVRRRSPSQTRTYASVQQHGAPATPPEPPSIPWPSTASPTPYEIFDIPKHAPYSKLRFYQLVKIYHPDRHHHTAHDGIPHLTKLERYRLVVAANDLLSDPLKRSRYDSLGMGWADPADARASCRAADRDWRREPGNAGMNATWEDWERWYDERDGKKKQEPLYTSNGLFVGIVGGLILLASWAQATTADHRNADLLEARDHRHKLVSRGLNQRQMQAAGLSKEARVQMFLKEREAWGTDPPSHRSISAGDVHGHPKK